MEPLTVSCGECRLDGTSACEDCVMSFLLADEPAGDLAAPPAAGGAVIVDAAEARAMKLLSSAGLVPRLRFERRVG